MKKHWWPLFAGLLLLTTEFAFANANDDTLNSANSSFEKGQYTTSQKLLKEVLEKKDLTAAQKTRALLLRSRVEYAFSGENGAKPWLKKLYEHNRDAELDPMVDTPFAHAYFAELKKEGRARQVVVVPSYTPPPVKLPQPPREEVGFFDYYKIVAPFGIGDFELDNVDRGLVYLSSEAAVVLITTLASSDYREAINSEGSVVRVRNTESYSSLWGVFSFFGLWGYEVAGRSETLYNLDAERTQDVRFALSFFPLGAAQYKNGHVAKAIGLGVAQGTFLTLGVFGPTSGFRRASMALFGATYIYSVFDGWRHHDDNWVPKANLSSVMILPYADDAGSTGAQLRYSLRF